jgi:hypothetical protein
MVCFKTQKIPIQVNFGGPENVYMYKFDGHLEYFMEIWDILRTFVLLFILSPLYV